MVYCGKPSRGCQNCKNRRVKCDETRPHCQNCKKTNRKCPGFPEEVDLIFRNETPGLRKKARKAAGSGQSQDALIVKAFHDDIDTADDVEVLTDRARRRNGSLVDNGSDERPASVALRRGGKLIRPLSGLGFQVRLNPSIEQQATTFFFKHFVLPPRSKETTRGFLEVAMPMFDQAKEDSALYLATEAVAISVIANWPGRKHLAHLAGRLYGKALAAAQRAIRDPKQATSDETLLAILLFSLYESITSSDHSVSAWASHIDGAVAIAKARGIKQFQNPQSLLLFRAVRTQMLTNAIQQHKSIDDFPGPNGWLSDLEGDQSASFSLIEFSIRLPNILSRAKPVPTYEKTSENVIEVTELLHEAEAVQLALLDWEAHMPSQWAYKSAANVAGTVDPGNVEEMEAWPGPMHMYKDVHISSIRNNNRVSQILCAAVVIDCLRWLEPENYRLSEKFKTSRNRIQTLVNDICYSVPFHLWGQDLGERARPDGQNRAAAEAIGGYFLIWPLYTASNMEEIPDIQRRWLRGRLWAIARHYGLEQANILNQLRQTEANSDGDHTTRPHRDSIPGYQNGDQSRKGGIPTPPESTVPSDRSSSSPVEWKPESLSHESARYEDGPAIRRAHDIHHSFDVSVPDRGCEWKLHGTQSLQTFVRAADLLLEMTRTMEVSPCVHPYKSRRISLDGAVGQQLGIPIVSAR